MSASSLSCHTAKRRWFTCTPVAFKGDHTFFCRDTGLFSRSFRKLGFESKAVMPLPGYDVDYVDEVLRTEYRNLESADWWRSLDIEGVLLYSWGAPRYTKIARAIHEAGVKLVVFMDFNGDFSEWWTWRHVVRQPWAATVGVKGWKAFSAFCRSVWRHGVHDMMVDVMRSRHLRFADVVVMGNPFCRAEFERLAWIYGSEIKRKGILLPCPVDEKFSYDGTTKEYRVISIGRWDDDYQKRPAVLMRVLEELVRRDHEVAVDLYGQTTEVLRSWHAALSEAERSRILLHGVVRNEELLPAYRRAMVSFCCSSYESAHIVSVEAICCGASIVTSNRKGLASLHWYASEESGTISPEDTPESMADALLEELKAWKNGRRDPSRISRVWTERMYAVNFLPQLLEKVASLDS